MYTGTERRKIMSGGFENCPLGVKHEAEIQALKEASSIVAKDVKDIKERLLARPSWVITVIISLLSTLAFSALTFSFTIVHALTRLNLPN